MDAKKAATTKTRAFNKPTDNDKGTTRKKSTGAGTYVGSRPEAQTPPPCVKLPASSAASCLRQSLEDESTKIMALIASSLCDRVMTAAISYGCNVSHATVDRGMLHITYRNPQGFVETEILSMGDMFRHGGLK